MLSVLDVVVFLCQIGESWWKTFIVKVVDLEKTFDLISAHYGNFRQFSRRFDQNFEIISSKSDLRRFSLWLWLWSYKSIQSSCWFAENSYPSVGISKKLKPHQWSFNFFFTNEILVWVDFRFQVASWKCTFVRLEKATGQVLYTSATLEIFYSHYMSTLKIAAPTGPSKS